MAKDFTKQLENTYNIPSSLMIMSGFDPADTRQTCDTVEDFETFKQKTGMELRYPGLITYEGDTRQIKVCERGEDGEFIWSTIILESEFKKVEDRLQIVEDKVFSYDILFTD